LIGFCGVHLNILCYVWEAGDSKPRQKVLAQNFEGLRELNLEVTLELSGTPNTLTLDRTYTLVDTEPNTEVELNIWV
jgi:hypothetical protein